MSSSWWWYEINFVIQIAKPEKFTDNFSLDFYQIKSTYSENKLVILNDTKILRYYETRAYGVFYIENIPFFLSIMKSISNNIENTPLLH